MFESLTLQALQLLAQLIHCPLIRFDALSHEVHAVELVHARHLELQRKHWVPFR